MRIDQLTAGFAEGDAISGIAMELQKLFRSWGHDSEIYAMPQFTSPRMRGLCTDYREHRDSADPRDIMVFHFSIGGELVEFFRNLRCRKVLSFHNITPPEYYAAIDPAAARRLEEGYARLASLRECVDLALADSEFNKSGLVAAGYANVEVVPPLIDFGSLNQEPDADMVRRRADVSTKILFVGRIVPNKKLEDVIKVFYFYQKAVNPQARLFLVGSYAREGRYYSYLRGLVTEMKMVADVRDVVFAGHATFRELLAYYRLADVFLCMSEHEGFCIPLLEAMHFGIPIIAYRAGAVPETLGGASVVVNEKQPEAIAEMIHEVVENQAFREKIIEQQKRRLSDFRREKVADLVRERLRPLIEQV